MSSIGWQEIVIVLFIALLVFGPRKLPEMGRSLGKSIREFRQATSGIREELGLDADLNELKNLKTDLTSVGGEAAAAQPQANAEHAASAEPQAEAAAGSDEVLTGEVVADEPEQPVGSSTG
jgi:sec-independent protein translocase protein TatA